MNNTPVASDNAATPPSHDESSFATPPLAQRPVRKLSRAAGLTALISFLITTVLVIGAVIAFAVAILSPARAAVTNGLISTPETPISLHKGDTIALFGADEHSAPHPTCMVSGPAGQLNLHTLNFPHSHEWDMENQDHSRLLGWVTAPQDGTYIVQCTGAESGSVGVVNIANLSTMWRTAVIGLIALVLATLSGVVTVAASVVWLVRISQQLNSAN
ncbi:hypothetical protein [Devriesea agamarum]|uniref:hypothetical protein n=1 Tax=Devriesea agamarum TaxID=472569 RepID=UPI00071C8BFE|nr:hypothetical protein [Devriesea agamarum]